MLRLNLSSDPEWIDLAYSVRVQVMPCTSAIMGRARGSEVVDALVNAGASEPELAVALAKEIGAIVILEWEGVGGADGEPLPVSPAATAALLDLWPMFEAFQSRYVSRGLLLDAEKNGFAPSPNGTSEGAKDTAKPARRAAKRAPHA